MKIVAHIGDCHFVDGQKAVRVKEASESVMKSIKEIQPDLIVIPGDLFDHRQAMDGYSAVNPLIQFLTFLGNIAPTIVMYGNETHDPKGSLEFIKTLGTKHPISISDRPEIIGIGKRGGFFHYEIGEEITATIELMTYLVAILPYPTKELFLAGKEASDIAEANQLVIEEIKKIMLYFRAVTQANPQVVSILASHANLDDAVLENGQKTIGKDIVIPKEIIDLSGCDIKCFNHIHKEQGYYAGSIYHNNYGEPQPRTFRVYRIDEETKEFTTENIPIATTPISLHEVKFNGDWNNFVDMEYENKDWLAADLRVRCYLTKEQRDIITDDEVGKIYAGYKSIAVERLTLPEMRMRSTQISKAQTLRDKVIEWAKLANVEINERVLMDADRTEKENMQ